MKKGREEREARFIEMKRLRFEEHWSLQRIATKYGISRERVRQILGNTGFIKINKN